jgi:DNA-binding Lrp family transcriptional regulator
MTDGEDDILARVIDIAMELRPDSSGRIKLPTERELADQLGIQRPTLRDRLTVLETLGLLQRVQGSGTYLALPNSRFLQFYFGVALKLGFISIDQIQNAMEMIGREMAGAAAIHASAADFEELDRLIDEIAACDRDRHRRALVGHPIGHRQQGEDHLHGPGCIRAECRGLSGLGAGPAGPGARTGQNRDPGMLLALAQGRIEDLDSQYQRLRLDQANAPPSFMTMRRKRGQRAHVLCNN